MGKEGGPQKKGTAKIEPEQNACRVIECREWRFPDRNDNPGLSGQGLHNVE